MNFRMKRIGLIAVGAGLGFAYYYFIGCTSGSCHKRFVPHHLKPIYQHGLRGTHGSRARHRKIKDIAYHPSGFVCAFLSLDV
ncbi:MAG: hypothetical protein HW407_563 [Bacteroidetes bacterium]|nr:hypothetical protein [Bacteroidota bacterium]